MRILLLVIFGSVGTLARYALQGLVQERTTPTFPYGTMVVNLAGCFLLGGVGQYALNHISFPAEWRIAVSVGFFGAFTTFSTFGWETVHMLEDGEWMRAALYVGLSVIGGLALLRWGMYLGDHV